MAFEPENLGLSATGLPLLRDLIHERTGLFYDNGRCDTLADRLAPLVIERGFHTFLDFYYLLRYDEPGAATEWRRVMDALSVQETYFWREIRPNQGNGRHDSAGAAAGDRRQAGSDLERSMRHRRRTTDDRHGAERGRVVRAGADHDSRERWQPRRRREGPTRPVPRT
jgi:hypothetical protein